MIVSAVADVRNKDIRMMFYSTASFVVYCPINIICIAIAMT